MSSTANPVSDIVKTLELDTSPDRVWEAISDPARLAEWFPNSVDIESVSPGSQGWFVWDNHGRYRFEIEEVRAPEHLVWRWANDPEKELEATLTTRVEWRVEARPQGGTRLIVRETGFQTEEYRAGNDEGWDKELGELVQLLAGG